MLTVIAFAAWSCERSGSGSLETSTRTTPRGSPGRVVVGVPAGTVIGVPPGPLAGAGASARSIFWTELGIFAASIAAWRSGEPGGVLRILFIALPVTECAIR